MGEPEWGANRATVSGTNYSEANSGHIDYKEETNSMATKIKQLGKHGKRSPDSKHITFDGGTAKNSGKGLPMKTSTVEKE